MAHLISKYTEKEWKRGSLVEMSSWRNESPKSSANRMSSLNGAIAAYGGQKSDLLSSTQKLLNDLYGSVSNTPKYQTYHSPSPRSRPSILQNGTIRNPKTVIHKDGSLSSRSHTSQQQQQQYGTDTYYMGKIADVLGRYSTPMFTSSPSRITDYMYIGGYGDADNWPYLRRLGITHVLNMAGPRKSSVNPYPPASGIVAYEMFDADDSEYYDIMQHFPRARAFIDRAKYSGGKVLVHCAMGINRSGAMCCAYLMAEEKLNLIESFHKMKRSRGMVLCNRSFQKQLLRYARQRGHL